MEAFEFKGKWQLPESPKQALYGILSFNPSDGATLYLITYNTTELLLDGIPDTQTVKGWTQFVPGSNVHIEIIHGINH